MEWNAQLQIVAEVALAMLLGGVIGLERELANKPSGFRTHMLVAAATALFVGLGDGLLERFHMEVEVGLQSDPFRLVQAIVTGISFLGAGTIFRHKDGARVEGITTAATILMVSAIGIGVALRQYLLSVVVTLLVLVVLRGLSLVEGWLEARKGTGDA